MRLAIHFALVAAYIALAVLCGRNSAILACAIYSFSAGVSFVGAVLRLADSLSKRLEKSVTYHRIVADRR